VGRGVGGGVVAPKTKRKTRTLTQTEFFWFSPPDSLGKRLYNLSIYRELYSQPSPPYTISLVKCILCLHPYTIRICDHALDHRPESHVVEIATFSDDGIFGPHCWGWGECTTTPFHSVYPFHSNNGAPSIHSISKLARDSHLYSRILHLSHSLSAILAAQHFMIK
jgi:hypothetical protein